MQIKYLNFLYNNISQIENEKQHSLPISHTIIILFMYFGQDWAISPGPRKANPCSAYQAIDLLISSILGNILKMPSSNKIYYSFLLYYLSITLLYSLLYPTHPPTNLMEVILGILTYFSECDVLKEESHRMPNSTYCSLILALA